MYYLYQKDLNTPVANLKETPFLLGCELKIFSPKLWCLSASYEEIDFKTWLSRLQFWFSSKGRFKIYHLCDDANIVHTAYLVHSCRKFSFLKECDFEIGPCVTTVAYRRKGAYRYMLSKILEKEAACEGAAYMIVRDTNIASINGIESVGFVRIGKVNCVGLLKNYRLEM